MSSVEKKELWTCHTMSNIRLTLANNIDFDESYSHVKILVHPSVFFVVSYHFANARRIFLIFREVLQISYFFVENFTEFYRATGLLSDPMFSIFISLFSNRSSKRADPMFTFSYHSFQTDPQAGLEGISLTIVGNKTFCWNLMKTSRRSERFCKK